MTDELRAALLAERYAEPVPEVRYAAGPTLWWQQHLAAEEAHLARKKAWAARKPYAPKREAS